jgi:hypothetical protein
MLFQEPDVGYMVYPSWAEASLGQSWSDIAEFIRNPQGPPKWHGDEVGKQVLRAAREHSFVAMQGAAGGGIIVMRHPKGPGRSVGPSHCNIPMPEALLRTVDQFTTDVRFLEPYGGLGGLLATGKHSRLYYCDASAEHTESAENSVYWCLEFERNKPISGKAIDAIPSLAAAFGFNVLPLSRLPEAISDETAPWFQSRDHVRLWFNVATEDRRAGLHLAVMLYIGLHVAKQVRSIRWAHLIARIDGKPNGLLALWRRNERILEEGKRRRGE